MKYNIFQPVVLMIGLFLIFSIPGMAQFQRIYGDGQGNSFHKAVPDEPGANSGFYVIGTEDNHGIVSRISKSGQIIWTIKFIAPCVLTDAAYVFKGPGQPYELMVVGFTLPLDQTNNSLLVVVKPNGGLQSSALYDIVQNGVEGFVSITQKSGGLAVTGFFNDPSFSNNVVLLDVLLTGTINFANMYGNTGNNGFFYDVEIFGPNDYIVAGYDGNAGVIFRLDNSAPAPPTVYAGVRDPSVQVYTDIALKGSDVIAAGPSINPGGKPLLRRFDVNLFPVWTVEVDGLEAIHQVETNSNGDIYVVGTQVISGIERAVVVKIDDSSGTPVHIWAKYLDNGETGHVTGYITILQNLAGDIVFADGKTGVPNNFGQGDAFLALTDANLTTLCISEHDVFCTPDNPILSGPQIDYMDFTTLVPVGAMDYNPVDWQEIGACKGLKVVFDGLTYETQDNVAMELIGDSLLISNLNTSADSFIVQTDLTDVLSYDLWYSFPNTPGAAVAHSYFGKTPDESEHLLGISTFRQLTDETYEAEMFVVGQDTLQMEVFLDDSLVHKSAVLNGAVTTYIANDPEPKWDKHIVVVPQPGDRPDLVFIAYTISSKKKIALITPSGNIFCNEVTFYPTTLVHDTVSLTRAVAEVSGLPEIVFNRTIAIRSDSNLAFCPGDSVTLTAITFDDADFQWQKDLTDIPAATSNDLKIYEGGKYSAQITTGSATYKSSALPVNVLSDIECIASNNKGDIDSFLNLRLYPNPTSTDLTLEFQGTAPLAAEVQFLDLLGRSLHRQALQPGQPQHRLSVAALPAGVYFVKVTERGEQIWVQKIVKQ